eukprot:TRINITY_DN38549_c0_g1_i1.p1 TRINITY_DN38549_c0_g1~~TRINITY_DN38549_c0_g1_i1.p1  ORF type:complete len:218 (-),score=66.29 TRINITY_DN38549_c0_g1_i1:189-842(-)
MADEVQPITKINITSGNSGDTLREEAIGADEDDLEEATPGPKDQQLFTKIERYLQPKFGKKGSDKRPVISLEELQKHCTAEDFWVVLDSKVFDIGPFLRGEAKHPGGKKILQRQLAVVTSSDAETGVEAPPESRHDAETRFVKWHHPGGNAVRRTFEHFVGDLAEPLPDSMRDPERLAALAAQAQAAPTASKPQQSKARQGSGSCIWCLKRRKEQKE